jgi:hypothetical protein
MDDACYWRFETSNGKCLYQGLNVIVSPLRVNTDRKLYETTLDTFREIEDLGFYFVALRPGSKSTQHLINATSFRWK